MKIQIKLNDVIDFYKQSLSGRLGLSKDSQTLNDHQVYLLDVKGEFRQYPLPQGTIYVEFVDSQEKLTLTKDDYNAI